MDTQRACQSIGLGRLSPGCQLVVRDAHPELTLIQRRAQVVNDLVSQLKGDQPLLIQPARVRQSRALSHYDFPLVDPVSNISEWPLDVWVETARDAIDLCERLFRGGRYCLRSVNTFALQLMSRQVVYLDLDSFTPFTPAAMQATIDALWRSLLRPLVLAANGNSRRARMLLFRSGGVPLNELQDDQELEFDWRAENESASPTRKIETLRRVLDTATPKLPPSTWSGYGRNVPMHDETLWDTRRRVVATIIEEVRPRSVIDLGCNAGWFSRLSAPYASRTVAVDREDDLLNTVWRNRSASALGVCPLWIDLGEPALSLHWASAPAFPTAAQRVKSDLSIWLALTHHLTLNAGLSFAELVALIASYTRRAALIEFVETGPDNPFTWTQGRAIPEWYNLGNFMRHLRTQFQSCQLLPEPRGNRRLILCREPRVASGSPDGTGDLSAA